MKTAIVIFSGGLDTTVCIPVLREEGFETIHTVTIDVGQPQSDIEQAEARAQQLGTIHTTIDAKAEFADLYCVAALKMNADYFGYPLSTAIARPLIAKKAAEHALSLNLPIGEACFVHGCTGKGNDQFRIEYGLRQYSPQIPIKAPVRERNWTRSAEIEYAALVGAPIGQSAEKIWSIDENLWGRSIEGGRLEDPNFEPPEHIFDWTSSISNCPDVPQIVEIEFSKGTPVAIDGVSMSPLQLIQFAGKIAGKNGIGRIDIMEDRMIGFKVRENYECPAAVLLIKAHKDLEALIATGEERQFKAIVDQKWATLVYQGLWDDPLFESLTAFSDSMQQRVTGTVRLKLYRGAMQVIGRESPNALYSEAVASFDNADALLQSSMEGMVKAHGMSSLLYAEMKNG